MKQGFTIIEMLVYMGILAIFLVVMSGAFVSILNLQLESEGTSGVQQDGQYILSRMIYDIQRSSGITTPSGAGSNSPSLVANGNLFSYAWDSVSKNLVYTDLVGSPVNLNSNETLVTYANFQRLSGGTKDTFQVTLTLKSVAVKKSGPEIRNVTTTIGLR